MFIWCILVCLVFVDVILGVGDFRYCFKFFFDDIIIMVFKLYLIIIIIILYCFFSFNILKKFSFCFF